jgi:hypothetical protein
MDPKDTNDILDILTTEGFEITEASAEDLTGYRDALAGQIEALRASFRAGELVATDPETVDATKMVQDALAQLDAELDARAAAEAARNAELADLLGITGEDGDADPETAPEPEASNEPETVDEPADDRVPVLARKPFAFPKATAPAAVDRSPGVDPGVTASGTPGVQYYSGSVKVDPDTKPLSEREFAASWEKALKVGVKASAAPIGYMQTASPQAVRLDPNARVDDGILATAHAKWAETYESRLLANQPNASALPRMKAFSAACSAAPARPILDIGMPCEVTSFVDAFPTVETTEKVEIYPRPEVDYSVMQAGTFVVTETQHYAGYVSDGGTTADKPCDTICPPGPVSCEPFAAGYCINKDSFTDTFWKSALASSEAIMVNAAKLLADYVALEKMYDPTGANPLVRKLASITASPFGFAPDLVRTIEETRAVVKQCTGCEADSVSFHSFLLQRAIADHMVRFGTNVLEARNEVLGLLGANDGVTVRTFDWAPANWLLSGGAAELPGGQPFGPQCGGTGDALEDLIPRQAPIFVGFTDGLYVGKHAEISMSVQRPSTNRTEMLFEGISTLCITRGLWVVDMPVCIKGSVGAMAAVACG